VKNLTVKEFAGMSGKARAKLPPEELSRIGKLGGCSRKKLTKARQRRRRYVRRQIFSASRSTSLFSIGRRIAARRNFALCKDVRTGITDRKKELPASLYSI
jgi:hypothetical protein